jgi:putative ABC transport system permease protein
MRFAIRNLGRHPGLVFVIVAMLTAAQAFVIASLSLLNGLLVRPYSFPKLRRLMLVRDSKPREGVHQGRSIAIADFLDARESVPAFSNVAAWRARPLVITSAGADPERVEAAAVTANFLTTLGVSPIFGRGFTRDADTPGHDNVVLLSRRLWNSRFGADPSIAGRTIGLNGRQVTVVGVIRDEDCYEPGIDAWVPLVFTPADVTDRTAQPVSAIGRLRDGATEREAKDQLASLSRSLGMRYPTTNRGRGFDLLPLQREQYEFTAPLFPFVQAAGLLVLLIATINVSNLLVARTLDRRAELAVRSMLGASAAEVAGAPVAEVVALTTASAGWAAWFAGPVLNVIRASLPEGIARWIAGWSSLRVDSASLAAGAGVALLVTIAISTAIALTSLRLARASEGSLRVTRRSTWGRRVLVAGEVGLAAALLVGASVMIAGFTKISAAFSSLSPLQLLRFTLTLPEARYPDNARIASFHRAMLEGLRELPEVETAALIRNEPASNVPNPIVPFQRDDRPALQPSDAPRADIEVVSSGIFETLRLGIIEGRPIMEGDGFDGTRVAVISQTAARRFWRDRDPVGTSVRFMPGAGTAGVSKGIGAEPVRIVGVVSDCILNWYDPDKRPVIFLPDNQDPARTTSVIVRTRTNPMSIARRVRDVVARLDDRQPLSEIQTLSASIADSLSPIRVIERLLLGAAALSALLAAGGIYGVLAHWVGSRHRELGVRFALGATRRSIAGLVVREALLTGGAGGVAGMALAIMAIRLTEGALFGVPALDARVVVLVASSVFVLALAASLGPARRAARVDVAQLLRLE